MVENRKIEIESKLTNVLYDLCKLQAEMVLKVPVPLTYEDWCFLHALVDDEVEEYVRIGKEQV